jgi:hypothetical protein
MRISTITLLLAFVFAPASAFAQAGGFAIGPRVTFVRGSEDLPESSRRFYGGAMRLGGGRAALELSMDFRTSEDGPLNEKIRDYPVQASLLLFPVRARIAPYLLAGVGWYTQNVTRFVAPTGEIETTEETTREMGWHAGLGAELRLHRRFGIYGDLRYTRLGFGRDDDDLDGDQNVPGWIPGASLLRLSHDGSTFVWGANLYF